VDGDHMISIFLQEVNQVVTTEETGLGNGDENHGKAPSTEC